MSGFLQNTNATENTNRNQGKSKQMSRCVGFLLWRKEQTEDHWSHTWVFDQWRCLLILIFIFMFMMIINAVVDGNYQWISWLRISASSSRSPPMHEKHTQTLYLCLSKKNMPGFRTYIKTSYLCQGIPVQDGRSSERGTPGGTKDEIEIQMGLVWEH